MAVRPKGPVRYRFRSDSGDVSVVIEGDAEWVSQQLILIGLNDVGWTMPIATTSSNVQRGRESTSSEDEEVVQISTPKDMGPPPDPSRIPTVRRQVGSLDLQAELDALGIEQPSRPDPLEIAEALEDLEEQPQPVQDPLSSDPMAEAWLREIMRVTVRDFGVTGLSVEAIEKAAQGRLGGRKDLELEVWLDVLFRHGKLVKIHGGHKVGYGPSPSWLSGKTKTHF